MFIGNFNRLSTLQRTVDSYSHLSTEHELVIVDNGSDHPECVALLEELEPRVKKIYRLPACDSMDAAEANFESAIYSEYSKGDAEWFAVSEADICFEGTRHDALDRYIDLALTTGCAVGPHTRVDVGIPACYPLRSRVLATESRLLYRSSMRWSWEGVPYSAWPIDTTFHLFPRREDFPRLKMNTLRAGPPFDAMHLDWYLDIRNPNRENEIYLPGTRPVGSWGKAWIQDYWKWFQVDPEVAFERLLRERRNHADLDNNSFMLSWAYQYGHGVEADLGESLRWLLAAIPSWGDMWLEHRADWLAMIYEDDFSCLGWG